MLHNDATCDDCFGLLNAPTVAARFADATALWHSEPEPEIAPDDPVLRLHRANFTLWHMEDRARDPQATDSTIAGLKRSIDKVNQTRNDLVEGIDTALLQALAPAGLPAATAPLHSETPGLMLDRLSILALKIFHTREEVRRPDALHSHVERNGLRLSVLHQQSHDLAACLLSLWQEVCLGKRSYRIYRQMKMYNDPDLNPVLYGTSPPAARGPA